MASDISVLRTPGNLEFSWDFILSLGKPGILQETSRHFLPLPFKNNLPTIIHIFSINSLILSSYFVFRSYKVTWNFVENHLEKPGKHLEFHSSKDLRILYCKSYHEITTFTTCKLLVTVFHLRKISNLEFIGTKL